MKNIELWKNIEEFGNRYKISRNGDIYDTKRKCLLKQYFYKNVYVYLIKNNKRTKRSVARLVATYFVFNPYGFNMIYFIDGNHKNVCADNIQWNYTNKDTKIVVDGIIFNSMGEYKRFVKNNNKIKYLMNLNDKFEIKIPQSKMETQINYKNGNNKI